MHGTSTFEESIYPRTFFSINRWDRLPWASGVSDLHTKLSLIGSATYWVGVSSQLGHADILYRQKWVKVIFLHIRFKIIYSFQIWYTTYIASVLTRTDFCHGWAIFGPLGATNSRKRDLSRAPHQQIHTDFMFHQNWVPVTYFMSLAKW